MIGLQGRARRDQDVFDKGSGRVFLHRGELGRPAEGPARQQQSGLEHLKFDPRVVGLERLLRIVLSDANGT
jgi:hypothetical protein